MSKRTQSLMLALGALATPAYSQVRVGPEFRVNGYTTGYQFATRVAADAAGNFLVVWVSDGQDGSGHGVYARGHDATGEPLGAGDLRVNAYTTQHQRWPAVASAPDGRMVVTWVSEAQEGSSYGIYARRFPAVGGAPAAEFRVNAHTTGQQRQPSVAMDGSGNFVVVWSGAGPGDPSGVFGRRFNALGSAVGGDFRVNSYTPSYQVYPVVASDPAGNFVVAWQSLHQDGSGYGVFAQLFDAAGVPVGGEFRVNAYTTGQQREPAVASDAAGDFVVVWSSDQGGNLDVRARRYDAGGQPRGGGFLVNLQTFGNQYHAAVASDPGGGFVVAWQGATSDSSGWGLFGRHYDSSGTPDPYEFALNVYTTGQQTYPAMATDAQGDFVATWSSNPQDGDGYGVFAQRFRPDLILRDGFEDGTLGAWSLSATDGGDLSLSPAAALKATATGLRAVVDDTAGLYVQDDRPRDERRYRARFYFDPNGFDPGEAQSHRRTRIFLAFSEAPTRRVAAIVLRRVAGEYAIRGRARLDDNTQAETPFIPIADGPHVIEFDLGAAATPTSSDGYFVLSVDGVIASVAPLDNSLAEVDFVRVGALSVKPGANGTMYWDEFESRRQGGIGP